MKNFVFFIATLLILSSCSLNYKVSSSYTDLREFTKEGFLITTGDMDLSKYDPIAIVTATSHSGQIKVQNKKDPYGYKYCNEEEAFAELKTRCDSLGANGVINLKVERNGTNSVIVSGLAVKIK